MPDTLVKRPPTRRLWPWLGAAVLSAATLSGCAALDEKQREWIFQPSTRAWPGALSAAEGMAEVWIPYRPTGAGANADASTGDAAPAEVRLHGLWLPQPRADAPVMLYLHGARWDVRGSAPRMRRMHELGFAVLGVDYRGFGRSTPGLPSEDSALEDANAAWRWLQQQHPQARHYLFGHSLGGAIAVRLAAELAAAPGEPPTANADRPPRPHPPLAGLIVENSFTSIPDVVKQFKYGWLPVSPLITQRFDAAQHIAQVKAPVLVVHGSADTLIPPALGQALYARAPEPKRFVLVEGGSHHSTNGLAQPQYRDAVAALFGLQPGP